MWCQKQISEERYDILVSRYHKFLENLDDVNQEPVQVFDPLTPKQLQELELIREVSRDLQAKKEEDARKAAQAKEEAKLKAEEKSKETEEPAPVEEPKKEE